MTTSENPRARLDAALEEMRSTIASSSQPVRLTAEATVACAEALSLLVDAHLPHLPAPEPEPDPDPRESLPPTCWDEWEPGDVWAWNGVVYRMGDDRVLRLATRNGAWVDAGSQPGGAWVPTTLTAPTDGDMARVAAADEAARLPDEPPVGSFALDRNGGECFRTVDGWRGARSGRYWEWAELHRKCGPVTVIHRAAP